MRSRAPALIAALTIAVIGVSATTTGAATQTKVPRDCIHEAVKPHHITITCADGNFFLSGLTWSRWARKVADGKGTANVNDCVPFCAHGHFHKYSVSVRLSSAHYCRNARQTQFRRLRVIFTRAVPKGFKERGSQAIACPLK